MRIRIMAGIVLMALGRAARSASRITFAYAVEGVSQSKAIPRQIYATPNTICR